MNTYFAPPEKADKKELATEIEIVSKNPLVTELLHSVGGLLAILDEHRQIVALNDSLLKMMGMDDPEQALGLRQGEALQCVHAQDGPAGCGTTKFCSSCGAAIAMVSSLEQNIPVEKMCALEANRGGNVVDIALLVRSHPVKIDNKRFLLIFIQDITQQQQRAALERTFFHDVNNMLSGLLGVSELLVKKEPSELASTIHQASTRLHKEIAIQRCLAQSESSIYQPMRYEIQIKDILEELQSFFGNHPIAEKKNIELPVNYPKISINIDLSLLLRVLCNMILNALEATEENGVVKIWIEHEDDLLSFCVWNAQEIPQEIANRIFQRNFSTKEQAGRGIGTFSMKLFGEQVLGGQVSFKSSRKGGTIFKFTYPLCGT